jgi:hypothetical protein
MYKLKYGYTHRTRIHQQETKVCEWIIITTFRFELLVRPKPGNVTSTDNRQRHLIAYSYTGAIEGLKDHILAVVPGHARTGPPPPDRSITASAMNKTHESHS